MANTWDRRIRETGISDRVTNLSELNALITSARALGLSLAATVEYPEVGVILIQETKSIDAPAIAPAPTGLP